MKKYKKVEEKCVVWLAVEITKRIRLIEYSIVFPLYGVAVTEVCRMT